MRETRTSGSEGGVGLIAPFLPLSTMAVGDMSPLFPLMGVHNRRAKVVRRSL